MKSRKQLRNALEKALLNTLSRLKLPKSTKKIRKAASKAADRLAGPIRKELRKIQKQVAAGKNRAAKKIRSIRRK